MNPTWRTAAIIAMAAAGATCASPAPACTPVPGYRIPYNFELVEQADLIVLARVKGALARPAPGPEPQRWGAPPPLTQAVILTPLQVLKGRLGPGELHVEGVTYDWENGANSEQPHVTRLNEVHPSTYAGACKRLSYPVGGMLIAMFRKTPDGFVQLDHPYAREIEDVEGPDGVWVRAVRLYVSLLSRPAGPARRAALATAERSLLSHPRDAADVAIARDIRGYLTRRRSRGLHPPEPGDVPRK